ncbi:MAG TPA: DNA-binding protein [Nitrososphaeraceae archaeon]
MASEDEIKNEEDPDIAIIKARKIKEMRKQAAELEKAKTIKKQQAQRTQPKTDREIVLEYLYDRAEEVLKLAESQFPSQTNIIVSRIADLIRIGELQQRISGGELLMLFRSIGINVRLNTSIKIEDHGKLVSFSDKLRQENEETLDK